MVIKYVNLRNWITGYAKMRIVRWMLSRRLGWYICSFRIGWEWLSAKVYGLCSNV